LLLIDVVVGVAVVVMMVVVVAVGGAAVAVVVGLNECIRSVEWCGSKVCSGVEGIE